MDLQQAIYDAIAAGADAEREAQQQRNGERRELLRRAGLTEPDEKPDQPSLF